MREMKSSQYAVKAISDRTVIGIASVFGNTDSVYDIVWPGAYQKTIQEQSRRIKHLWMHDPMMPPVAVLDALEEVGRDGLPGQVLMDAPNALGGLQITRTYLDTPRGNEILAGIKAGAINELSIGYDAVKFDFNEVDGEQVRNLRELRLWDTSDVTWGANDATANFAKMLRLPDELLLKHIEAYLAEIKAGARHSAADVKLLNTIHHAAVGLGATLCKGIVEEDDGKDQTDEGKSRADAKSLTLLRNQLVELELSLISR